MYRTIDAEEWEDRQDYVAPSESSEILKCL
jgi:hypothetical protein